MAAKTIERRVSNLEEIIDDIPRLINMRFSFIGAALDAMDARIGTVEAQVDRLDGRLTSLKAQIEALPRVLAEMLDERA
jgi:hypothetical protein